MEEKWKGKFLGAARVSSQSLCSTQFNVIVDLETFPKLFYPRKVTSMWIIFILAKLQVSLECRKQNQQASVSHLENSVRSYSIPRSPVFQLLSGNEAG